MVTYHYTITNAPDWARSQEVKSVYPIVATELGSNPSDMATLIMSGNHWEYMPRGS